MQNLSWQAPEHIYQEKTSDWYWIVGIITISIAIISIILNNVIFAILILVSSFTLSLFASKKPEIIDVEIDDRGIVAGKADYPYSTLDSFWVETRESYPKIILKSKKLLSPYIVILIEDVEPEKVKELLLEHLPEEEHVEPFLAKLLVYLGF